ncbi:NACHT, LRR and PYD domains-containing protein 3-like [Rhea pennata]|uniref:NACHT, LRR and PYD domains-containing protein 3-like n=1 Tax=Rhea pennata TaxID=8795 RepID=UPI002E264621
MAGENYAIDVLLKALQDLAPEDFLQFKNKLSYISYKERWNIPKNMLETGSNVYTLVNCMKEHYGEDVALEIAIGVFEEMNQRDLANKIQDEKVKEYKQKYRAHVIREFLQYKEVNACLGENLTVSSRYINLSIVIKPHTEREGEQEAIRVSQRHADTDNKQANAAVTVAQLFQPTEEGQVPRTTVLVGAAGMGKTMTMRKIMVEWAEGVLYRQFDYVFYLNCKEINPTKEVSAADLISKCCPHRSTPIGKILDSQKKVLFLIDGLDYLRFSLLQPVDDLSSDPREKKPLETILISLFKKIILPESSLLITTRPIALQNLGQCLEGECYAEILGFSEAARKQYFHRFFDTDNKADTAFRFVKGNKILFTMCLVPIMSWTVCTVLEQELHKNKNLMASSKTTTRMYVFYLSRLLKCRAGDSKQDLQQFLHKLCCLAADGMWMHKVLFEEKEIKKRGLDQPDLLSLFLNENILKKGTDHGNVYSFIHLHLQEFFAAMFYVLEDEKETVDNSGTQVKHIKMLLENYSESRRDLMLTVSFLFGLVNGKSIEYMDQRIGCRLSPKFKEAMLRSIQTRPRGISPLGEGTTNVKDLAVFHCLFEIYEEDFVKRALNCFTGIDLHDIRLTQYDQMALSFCIKQWNGLDSVAFKGCAFKQQGYKEEVVAGCAPGLYWEQRPVEEQQSPIFFLCQALRNTSSKVKTLRLHWCGLAEGCCEDLARLLATQPSLDQLELGDNQLGDSCVRLLCEGLRQPTCRLRALRLWYFHLTSACCEDLAAVLSTSQHLMELDLSYNDELRDAGVQLLCEGLQHPTCQLQMLRLGSCRLTGTCCGDLAALLLINQSLTCLDLSDNELGDGGVQQLCQLLKHPACRLQTVGLNTSGFNEETQQELAALKRIKPNLKIGYFFEQESLHPRPMVQLTSHQGVLLGRGGGRVRKIFPSFMHGPFYNRNNY